MLVVSVQYDDYIIILTQMGNKVGMILWSFIQFRDIGKLIKGVDRAKAEHYSRDLV